MENCCLFIQNLWSKIRQKSCLNLAQVLEVLIRKKSWPERSKSWHDLADNVNLYCVRTKNRSTILGNRSIIFKREKLGKVKEEIFGLSVFRLVRVYFLGWETYLTHRVVRFHYRKDKKSSFSVSLWGWVTWKMSKNWGLFFLSVYANFL